ncbi:MAG: hypothetical protein WBQ94_04235 [Terracidiphilus sp.]
MPSLNWRCVGGTDPVDLLIKYVTRGTVNHVEFLVDGTAIGAHALGGVAIRPVAPYPFELRFTAAVSQAQYDAAMAFLKAQIGKPYDFIDIAGIVFARSWHDPGAWMCSELWAATMEAGKIVGPMDGSINLFTPQDSLVISCAMFRAA